MSPKMEKFIEEYLIDGNAAAAAVRAGYSVRSAKHLGARLLKRPEVQVRLRSAGEKYLAKIEVTADDIRRQAQRLAFGDVRQFFHDDGSLKLPKDWPDDVMPLVAGYEVTEHGPKIRFWDRRASVDLLARLRRLYDPAMDPNTQGRPIMNVLLVDEIHLSMTDGSTKVIEGPRGQTKKVLEAERYGNGNGRRG